MSVGCAIPSGDSFHDMLTDRFSEVHAGTLNVRIWPIIVRQRARRHADARAVTPKTQWTVPHGLANQGGVTIRMRGLGVTVGWRPSG